MQSYEIDIFKTINNILKSNFIAGVYVKNIEVLFNEEVYNQERDVIIKGDLRLENGIPLLKPLNIEIERRRLNKKIVSRKYDPHYLLSFISPMNNKSLMNSSEVYSFLNINNLDNIVINNLNTYTMHILSENSINALESILLSNIDKRFKKEILFFLGDLAIIDKKIKRIEYFKSEKVIKVYYENKSINYILYPFDIYKIKRNKKLHKGKNILITDKDNLDVDKNVINEIIVLSRTNKEVRLGSSLESIKNIKLS